LIKVRIVMVFLVVLISLHLLLSHLLLSSTHFYKYVVVILVELTVLTETFIWLIWITSEWITIKRILIVLFETSKWIICIVWILTKTSVISSIITLIICSKRLLLPSWWWLSTILVHSSWWISCNLIFPFCFIIWEHRISLVYLFKSGLLSFIKIRMIFFSKLIICGFYLCLCCIRLEVERLKIIFWWVEVRTCRAEIELKLCLNKLTFVYDFN